MSDPIELKVVDGRRLRSERRKKAILEACEQAMRDGDLVPTAQSISDRAGIPIRTFFRHFPDMESLFYGMDDMLKARYRAIYAERESTGTVSQRIASAIVLRTETFEEDKSIIRSTKSQLWRYKVLRDNYKDAQHRLRKDLLDRVPELKQLHKDEMEMVDALASFETWERFRHHQGLSIARSSQLMHQMVESIVLKSLKAKKKK